uniref:NADH-ubiquinone oxidoreductase chain 4 n=1 Tax=Pimpla luctuosa TaxID=495389 RepID=A0A3Q8UA85_9HYME|nr:NADH dehydrogenase subunit 4 [Pimpla luctuosa]
MMGLIFLLMFYFMFIKKVDKNLILINYIFTITCGYFYMVFNFPLNMINLWMNIYYMFSMDLYSFGLILLTGLILELMLLTSVKIFLKNNLLYMYIMNMLLLILILCFSSINLMLFYVMFESSLIPVFMLIMGWGFQVDRIQAGFYMMLYTLIGSMPLFFMIIYLYMNNNSLMMNLLKINQFSFLIYIFLVLAFLIKMPMYFVHLWLPKAHVEAPVMGSMILAGIMLKLGSYGLMRILLMMVSMSMKFNKIIIIISLMGGLYSSLMCLCQIDMKMLVAYSSVVHMSLLMSGMMTLFNWGMFGGYLMMLSHGLCSSGMFCLVNINYERLMSRSLYINKGLINYFPSFSLMWFLLCSSNMSFPPSLNLFSEILLLNSVIIWSKLIMLILMVILFLSASYTLYLYSYSQHGKMNSFSNLNESINILENFLILFHWIPLNGLYLFLYFYL